MNLKVLATVATANYTKFLYTFMESARQNLKVGEYKIVVLYDSLTEAMIFKAMQIAKDHFDVSFFNVHDYSEKHKLGKLMKNPVYLRLIAPYVPYINGAEKLLYIDLDTLILEDISDLFNYDLQGKTAGACIDYLPEMQYGVNNWESLNLEPHAPYFNAGVLLMDLPKYKAKEISYKVIKIVIENDEHLLAFGRWAQNDQYGLNVALVNDWVVLPPYFNYGSELPYKQCKILHFIGNGKPDSPTCKPEFTAEFEKYSEKYK